MEDINSLPVLVNKYSTLLLRQIVFQHQKYLNRMILHQYKLKKKIFVNT